MQLKLLALSLLTALAAADNENLSEIVDDFPECSLPCFAQKADDSGCQTTDFSCVCNKQVEIAARMGGCLSDYCDTLDNFSKSKLTPIAPIVLGLFHVLVPPLYRKASRNKLPVTIVLTQRVKTSGQD